MAEEKKLGPNVTYTNPDKGAKIMNVAGVIMKEGESVDLEKKLGKEAAAPILKKLAGNRYFKVDGGPDHSKESEEQPPGGNEDQAAWAVTEEARIRKTEGDEAADKFIASLDDTGTVKADEQAAAKQKAEANYKAPEKPTLENQPRRRGE